jgi:ATP-dependent Lon protease
VSSTPPATVPNEPAYFGESKSTAVKLFQNDERLNTIEATASNNKLFLENKVFMEKEERVLSISNEAAARATAVNNKISARINAVNALKVYLEDKLYVESQARNSDKSRLLSMINGEATARVNAVNSLNSEILNINSNISQIIATEISNQQYDFTQQEAIRAVCAQLQMTDSHLYSSIAQKSAIYAENVDLQRF